MRISTNVQVSTLTQWNPADGLSLDLGQFCPEDLFDSVHALAFITSHGVAPLRHSQVASN